MTSMFRRKQRAEAQPAGRKSRSQSLDAAALPLSGLAADWAVGNGLTALSLSRSRAGSVHCESGGSGARSPTPHQLAAQSASGSGGSGGGGGGGSSGSGRLLASDFIGGSLRQLRQLYNGRRSRDSRSSPLQSNETSNRARTPDDGVGGGGGGGRSQSLSTDSWLLEQQRVSPTCCADGDGVAVDRRHSLPLGPLPVVGGPDGALNRTISPHLRTVYNQRLMDRREKADLLMAAGATNSIRTMDRYDPGVGQQDHSQLPPVALARRPESARQNSKQQQQQQQERRFFSGETTSSPVKSHSSISSASVNAAALYRRVNDPYRRRSLSGGDVNNEQSRMAILFRDSRGLPVVDPFIDTLHSTESSREDEAQVYVKFFKFHKCYDLIPTSAKLVVFDTMLRVKKAFYALVFNGVRAAPLWDSKQQQFVGMLTITDFIRILKTYYRSPDVEMEELEEHKLDTWRTLLESRTKPLIHIEPQDSLYCATAMLLHNKIHRLPVIDPVSGDVLYIITHKRLLRFLSLYLSELPRPSFMDRSLEQLQLGTYSGVETATLDTPIIAALTKFVTRRVSALPIVDDNGRLVHIYAKFDAINLAAEKIYNELHRPLSEAISHRSGHAVESCYITNTVSEVVEQLVRAEVHRLVVVDRERRVIGVVSLSDILHALVICPEEHNRKSYEIMAAAPVLTPGGECANYSTAATTSGAANGGGDCLGTASPLGGATLAFDELYLASETHAPIIEEDGAEDEGPEPLIGAAMCRARAPQRSAGPPTSAPFSAPSFAPSDRSQSQSHCSTGGSSSSFE